MTARSHVQTLRGFTLRASGYPRGRPYSYRVPGPQGGEYRLFSYGRDGKPGGTGDDADIGLTQDASLDT